MRYFQLLLLFASTILLVGCGPNAEKKHEKLLTNIANENGIVLYDSYNQTALGKILYVTDEGLFYFNPSTDRTERLYSPSDTLTIHSFELTSNNPFEVSHTQRTQIGLGKDATRLSPKRIFKVKWPWINIGREYIASIFHPEILFDINDFEDTGNQLDENLLILSSSRGDNTRGQLSFDSDNSININIGGHQSLLPGFASYSPSTINQDLWANKEYLDPQLKDYFHIFHEAGQSTNELYFKNVEEETYHIPLNIGVDGIVEIADLIVWSGDTIYRGQITSEGLYPLYTKRENRIRENQKKHRIDKTKRTERLLVENNERRRAEEEAAAEAERQRLEDEWNWKIKNAASVKTIKNAYLSNSMKAQRNYPPKTWMVVKASLENIKHSSNRNYKYVMRIEYDLFDPIYIYTDDEAFTNLSYPEDVYIEVFFNGMASNTDFFTGITDHEFIFTGAKLLGYVYN